METTAKNVLENTRQAFEWGKTHLEQGIHNLEDEHIEWLIKQAENLQTITARWSEIEGEWLKGHCIQAEHVLLKAEIKLMKADLAHVRQIAISGSKNDDLQSLERIVNETNHLFE